MGAGAAEFAGRTAVVTGAGTGIGRAVAQRLAAGGARVALLGRREALLEEVAETLPGGAYVAPVDVRERGAVLAAFERVAAELGPVHACVANAGVGGPNRPAEGDRWDEVVRTNLDGSYFTLRGFERVMASGPELRHGVLMSSCLARFGVPGYTAYCASKAGLLGLARALALEWAEQGVLVNAICPGWVDTEMARRGMEDIAAVSGTDFATARADALAAVPLGRLGSPEEIAEVVAFLLGPGGRSFTGQALDPNGGSWMG